MNRVALLAGVLVGTAAMLVAMLVAILNYDRIAYIDSYAELSITIPSREAPRFTVLRQQRWSWLPGKKLRTVIVSREEFEEIVAGSEGAGSGIGCGTGGSIHSLSFELPVPPERTRSQKHLTDNLIRLFLEQNLGSQPY
jgi:hypothetical protein